MNCQLCLRIRLDEQLIELNSDEAQLLNAASILHIHFRCYFQVKSTQEFNTLTNRKHFRDFSRRQMKDTFAESVG